VEKGCRVFLSRNLVDMVHHRDQTKPGRHNKKKPKPVISFVFFPFVTPYDFLLVLFTTDRLLYFSGSFHDDELSFSLLPAATKKENQAGKMTSIMTMILQ